VRDGVFLAVQSRFASCINGVKGSRWLNGGFIGAIKLAASFSRVAWGSYRKVQTTDSTALYGVQWMYLLGSDQQMALRHFDFCNDPAAGLIYGWTGHSTDSQPIDPLNS